MFKSVFWKLSREEKNSFYQSKYEYYKRFNICLIVLSTLIYLTFFVTDCSIFGRFAYELILSRGIVIVPLIVFLILGNKTSDYRIMVPATYLMIHIIIWCTDWSTYLLPDRQFAIPGMVIMNLIFVCAGFAAPLQYGVIAHIIMVLDIAVANTFIHYDNIDMMYTFNVPCVLGVGAMHFMMQGVYYEHYLAKEKLQEMVVHDQLSGAYNRNVMKEIYDSEAGRLIFDTKQQIGMLLIDIDFFKKINDKYGHEAGDRAIVHISNILHDSVRSTDYVIRWGGEEFLIIMPECNAQEAMQIAENMRYKVENLDNDICSMSISVGVAMYDGGDYHLTIKKADEAMYRAKRGGRNQVVFYK